MAPRYIHNRTAARMPAMARGRRVQLVRADAAVYFEKTRTISRRRASAYGATVAGDERGTSFDVIN